ncbi:MAG: hypothetical protein Q8J60_01805, partial [Thiobacillus sp.]|nr:hypothetical protein [Thiobacillus sp.]
KVNVNEGRKPSIHAASIEVMSGQLRFLGSTSRHNAALCCGATGLLGGTRLCQPTRNVLVKHAGDERLVWHTFFKCLDLNVAQIVRGQADVDSAIFNGRSACCCLEFRELGLCGNGLQLAILKGGEDFTFIGINFRHLFHLDSNSPALLCGSGLLS